MARPRGPTPRKMRTGNHARSSTKQVSPEKNEPGGLVGSGYGLHPDLSSLFSPSPPVGVTPTSSRADRGDANKLSASPTANRTLHFASLAPRVTGQTSSVSGVAKPRPRPLSHAPAVARHLGVLEDDSALASPESGFSSDGSGGAAGPTGPGVVRTDGGAGGGIAPVRMGSQTGLGLGLGGQTGRGAFRVVGSFTPAPASAFVAVEKAELRRGSASDVEAARERVGRGDGPSGGVGERGGARC